MARTNRSRAAALLRAARNPKAYLKRLRRWLAPPSRIVRIGVPLQPAATPLDLLEHLNLGYCNRAAATDCYLDLEGSIVEPALFALRAACRDARQTLHLVRGSQILPALDRTIQAIPARHTFGLLVCSGKRIRTSRIVNVWRDGGGSHLRCFTDNLPVGLFPKGGDPARIGRVDTAAQFPVDVVYTWVNSADPDWQALVAPYRKADGADSDRFSQMDELRYSLRSLNVFAPWVRRVHVLTNCNPPPWLRENLPDVNWVMHDDVIPASYLPLFNSHAIESFLHRIEGLSEHFIYMNDDFMVASIAHKETFFDSCGRSIARLEPYGALFNTMALKEAGKAAGWQSAALNGAKLLEARFGVLPTRMHRHAPFALRRSVYAQMEHDYPEEFHVTRSARFREHTDVSFTSFLYHHYAAETGAGLRSTARAKIVRPSNYEAFEADYFQGGTEFFCVNDGAGSSAHDGYSKFKKRFLSKAFPLGSRWEEG